VGFTDYGTDSKHKHLGKTVFGKNERRALEGMFKVHADVPGPGNYTTVSEFGRYEIPTV
jgi:hypothetical protein